MSTRKQRRSLAVRELARILVAAALICVAALAVTYIGSHLWAVIVLIVALWVAVGVLFGRSFFRNL